MSPLDFSLKIYEFLEEIYGCKVSDYFMVSWVVSLETLCWAWPYAEGGINHLLKISACEHTDGQLKYVVLVGALHRRIH